jgi:enamine deaminase RidA (YjgF/YER057c/UK114 family)
MQRVMTVGKVGGRQVVSTSTRWEPVIGYSRAVRAGNWILVTGTIGLRPDGTCPDTAAEQMRMSLETVIAAVVALGGRREDIVRTRIYVTDIGLWEEIGRIHAEFLGDVRPATTMIGIASLAHEAAVLEVEADALIGT